MESLRKLINFLAMLFLVFALLVLLNVISITYLDSTLTTFNPMNFYKTIFAIAGTILLLVLVIDYLYTISLRRELNQKNQKINELKATLYDRKIGEPRENRNPGKNDDLPPASGPDLSFPNSNPPV